jgi:hypothetical protein
MSTWVGISPVIGAGSLEGFAVGATVTGAFLLVITPRRLRRRRAAAGTRSAPGSASSPEAEAFGAESSGVGSSGAGAFGAGAFGAEVEPAAQSQPGAQEDVGCTSPTGRAARAVAYRSRHRLGDPIPDGALPGAASRDDAQPDTPFPDVAFADVSLPGGVFRPSRRPAARLPRHAAPAVSFGTKVSGRVTGLFAARPLAGGAPS